MRRRRRRRRTGGRTTSTWRAGCDDRRRGALVGTTRGVATARQGRDGHAMKSMYILQSSSAGGRSLARREARALRT
eukprot:7188166-Pyramimonas_sp.AAC.1